MISGKLTTEKCNQIENGMTHDGVMKLSAAIELLILNRAIRALIVTL